jgi:hypothetical protein
VGVGRGGEALDTREAELLEAPAQRQRDRGLGEPAPARVRGEPEADLGGRRGLEAEQQRGAEKGSILAADRRQDERLAGLAPGRDLREVGRDGPGRRREPPAVGVLVDLRVAKAGEEGFGVVRDERPQRDRPVAVRRVGCAQRGQAAVP